MTKIEIVAIGEDKIYSVGAITVSKKGDVYHISKLKQGEVHSSRHASGKRHWKYNRELIHELGDGLPIKEFKGLESLGTLSFGLDSLPQLHKEYRMKKCNGIFAIDMREYRGAAFNMTMAILTKEGLPRLYNIWKHSKKRQIYLYTDSQPMIAITVADINKT